MQRLYVDLNIFHFISFRFEIDSVQGRFTRNFVSSKVRENQRIFLYQFPGGTHEMFESSYCKMNSAHNGRKFTKEKKRVSPTNVVNSAVVEFYLKRNLHVITCTMLPYQFGKNQKLQSMVTATTYRTVYMPLRSLSESLTINTRHRYLSFRRLI
jgi:hypothetical protein